MKRGEEKRLALASFGDHAGFIAARFRGGHWVVGYVAEEQGISAEDGGRYMALCNSHSTNVQVTSKAALMSVLRSGAKEFCDCCRGTCSDYLDCISCGRKAVS